MKLINSLLTIMFLIQPLSIKDEYDLIINQMSLREKVGQMFFIRLEALDPDYISDELSGKYIKHDILNDEMIDTYNEYPCGGIVLFAKNLNDERQLITLTNNIHNLNNRPLICIDEEGGVVSRIANSNKFRVKKTPNNNTMTTYDDAYNQGYYIGSYLKKYHIDIDFAPVADINSDSQNNIIGERSFGDNPILVSTMVNAFISGLHDNNIIACTKHFPGHGNSKDDSHLNEVNIEDTLEMLKEEELVPFINNLDISDMVMIGHIKTPNTTNDDLPASLSKEIITDILRDTYKYDGLVITDSFEMAAITKYYTNQEVVLSAIEAGVDILLMPENYKEAFDTVVDAVNNNQIKEERINESVKRILKLKTKYNLIEPYSIIFSNDYYFKKDDDK